MMFQVYLLVKLKLVCYIIIGLYPRGLGVKDTIPCESTEWRLESCHSYVCKFTLFVQVKAFNVLFLHVVFCLLSGGTNYMHSIY